MTYKNTLNSKDHQLISSLEISSNKLLKASIEEFSKKLHIQKKYMPTETTNKNKVVRNIVALAFVIYL